MEDDIQVEAMIYFKRSHNDTQAGPQLPGLHSTEPGPGPEPGLVVCSHQGGPLQAHMGPEQAAQTEGGGHNGCVDTNMISIF